MSARDRQRGLIRALGIGAEWLRGEERSEAIEQNAEVAKFNRQLDLFQLGLNKKQLEQQRDIVRRYEGLAWNEAWEAEQQALLRDQQAEFLGARGSYAEWLAGSRERRMDLLQGRQLTLDELQTWNARWEAERRGEIAGAGIRQLGIEREAQASMEAAQLGAAGARRRQLEVEADSARYRAHAGRLAVAAGEAQVGGARRALAAGAVARREARIERVGQEVGAGIASGAARGMRGSYRQTAALKATREGIRDIQLMEMEEGMRSLELDVQAAQLVSQRTGIDRAAEDALARTGAAVAALGAEQARIVQQGRVARAGMDVRGGELGRQVGVAAGQVREAGARVDLLAGRRGAMEEERQELRRSAAVERAGLSLQEAEARLAKHAAKREEKRARIGITERQYERQLGEIAIGINRWTRENLVELPDYEQAGTRSTLATILSMTSAAYD